MVSNEPSTEEVTGSATIGMGNHNSINTQGMINLPIVDKLAFRAAFNVTAHEGYISNGTSDDDTKSARLKLSYTPSDKISFF